MHKKADSHKDLLERYHRDNCTPTEKKIVEEWLNSDSTDDLYEFSSEEEKEKVRETIWTPISEHIKPQNRRYNKISFPKAWIAVAACSTIFLITSFFLGRDGLCQNKFAEISQNKTMEFCDKVVVTTDLDSEITFVSNCQSGYEISRTVTCKKGQTYLAINFRFRNDNEILVVTKDQLHELPHDIRIKVLKELNS